MSEQKLTIPIDKIKADFQQFIEPEHNQRIIFSGPFGIGKTYFLNEFFKKEEEYFSIFLRPINYSLLSNEDVFKFIKYDILAQLINLKKIDINEDFEVTTSVGLKSFLKNNKLLVLKNLLKVIPKLGGLADGISQIEELYLTYRESKEKLSKELSAEQVKIFNEDFEGHFLSEFDNVSEIIKETIEKEKDLKKVLIIDDLDRLDPEHIFRLFNVFSAHFDLVNDNSNKFGFDKIIFVCDIENIRKIFSHKYGSEVDFSGYIDKFYSTEVYQMIHKETFDNVIFPFLKDSLMRFDTEGYTFYYLLIKYLIEYLFKGNQLSLRDIQKLHGFRGVELLDSQGKLKRTEIALDKLGASYSCDIRDYSFLVCLKLLSCFFESNVVLIKKIKSAFCFATTDSEYVFRHEVKGLIPQLILFAEKDIHKFKLQEEMFQYELNETQLLNYKITTESFNRLRNELVFYKVDIEETNYEVSKGNFYQLLKKASEVLLDGGVI